MAYQPLKSCLYDLIEVFCMRGYDIMIARRCAMSSRTALTACSDAMKTQRNAPFVRFGQSGQSMASDVQTAV